MKQSYIQTPSRCVHSFDKKMQNGVCCSKCSVSLTFKSNTVGLKSKNYATRLHFDTTTVDKIFNASKDLHSTTLTNSNYTMVRQYLVKFIFDKAALLKLSKKTCHVASNIMDIYFTKKGHLIPTRDNFLVASCCLLLGAKAVELDDRIPFISKLKKYTSVQGTKDQFKFYEVDIAEVMDWDLQVLTFWDYVEHYLAKGVVSDEDKVFNKWLNCVGMVDSMDVTQIVEKLCSADGMKSMNDMSYSQKRNMVQRTHNSLVSEDSVSLIKKLCKASMKDSTE